VVLKPDYVEAYGNLGAALNRLKRHEEAIAHFERVLALQPGLAEAHADIGNALVALKRHEEAIERYRRAIAIRPRFADAHNNIGNALVILDRQRQAIVHFEAALSIDPDAFETRISLAAALSFIERHEEAVAHYRRALALRPDHADTYRLLGSALEAGSRPEEAVASLRHALEIRPNLAEAHNALGTSLLTLGRLAEGCRSIETAIALAPTRTDFHRNLAMATRHSAGDAHLQAMEELARDMTSLDDSQRMELHFALGKAYTDIERRSEALSHFIEANAIKRRQITYSEPTSLMQIERIKAVMTRDLLERKAGSGAVSELPIFIVGMPRSGSTLIEQILASHPAVFGAGEVGNFAETVARFCGASMAPALFTEIIPDMAVERLAELGASYLDSLRKLAPEAGRITDKMLPNFRMLGLIHLALPGARIIHARRDPLDNCLSAFGRNFSKSNQPFSYDLAELGRYYRAYDGLMAHWRNVLPAGVMIEVQYEHLVADLEPQARSILEHCGLDWDPRCLAFHDTERPVRTASVTQVREPLYRSSIGRWGSVRHMLGPLLDELGIEA
jgi:tetratricopeptide (TPR) repeat protein